MRVWIACRFFKKMWISSLWGESERKDPGHRRGGQTPGSPGSFQDEGRLSPQDLLETWVLWWWVCLACLTSQLWTWIDLLYCVHFALGVPKNGGVQHSVQRALKALVAGGAEGDQRAQLDTVTVFRSTGWWGMYRFVLLAVYRRLSISAAICIPAAVSPIQLRRRGKGTSWAEEQCEENGEK